MAVDVGGDINNSMAVLFRLLLLKNSAILELLTAEAEKLGGPTAGFYIIAPKSLCQPGPVQYPPEVLFVQLDAGDGLNRPLQFGQGKGGGGQFEHHGAIFQLASQTSQTCGEDSAVIGDHRLTKSGR